MRFVLDSEKISFKHLNMPDIEKCLIANFQDQFNIVHSNDNADQLVLRLRLQDLGCDDDEDDE